MITPMMLTERLGVSLLNFVWQGAALAAILAVVLAVLGRARPQARYLAACVTLALMAVAPVVTFLLLSGSVGREGSGSVAAVPVGAAYRVLTAAPRAYSAVFERALFWIVVLWVVGVVLLATRWVAAWIALERRVKRAAPASEAVQRAFDRVAESMQVARRIPVLLADWLESPAVSGVLRPVLLVPASAVMGLSAAQLEAVLAHELAHIKRWDTLVSLLQTAVETLYYFHPAVWWVSRRIRIEREHCCDDAAVAACGSRHTFASALAALEFGRHAAPAPILAASGPGGSLKLRIRRILYPADAGTGAGSAAGAVVLAAAVLAGWGGTLLWAAQSDRDAALRTEMATNRRWVNEDVGYIIKPAERKAFSALKTDEEREHFIEQFWERRNPEPGSKENKYKKEHYRRIAYSNDRFAETDLAGWRTDRGRIYIMYGPPDEIEVHPNGQDPPKREEWLYHQIPGIGTNVIVEFRNGRMTSDPNTGK
jgi:GWxTD domain-containing protein